MADVSGLDFLSVGRGVCWTMGAYRSMVVVSRLGS